MLRARLALGLLFTACFSLATCLQPRQMLREETHGSTGSVLALLLGDGRKMFANQMFAKADAYFHRGIYPSIFDTKPREEEHHMSSEAGEEHEHSDEHEEHVEKPAQARDWIEAFGRRFVPTQHVHLEGGNEREMLPWLKLSVELDPQRVESYTVTAYWLRDRLGKVDEAEQFLREGLRANPHSPTLLYELGRLHFESRKDWIRSENLWIAALRHWHEAEDSKKSDEQDSPLLDRILGGLSRVELKRGRVGLAIEYLKELKKTSPNPGAIQQQIDKLTTSP